MTGKRFRDPDALRARAGVAGDPRADQHFLVDDRVLGQQAVGQRAGPAADFEHV